jgi:hypothetical protein
VVRKLENYRVEQNNGSLKCYKEGKYIGSISIQVVCDAVLRSSMRKQGKTQDSP